MRNKILVVSLFLLICALPFSLLLFVA